MTEPHKHKSARRRLEMAATFRTSRRFMASMLTLAAICQVPIACTATTGQQGEPINMKVVCYEDFGAKGDGKTDDLQAIADAHAHANEHGLPVKANDAATYYIGPKDIAVVIQTDTDFGKANFIIDDTEVENRRAHVFEVRSAHDAIQPTGFTQLKTNQPQIDADLPGACVIVVTDKSVKHYIRKGLNQNSGSPQTDVFLVDEQGRVDPKTPIIWDFEQITDVKAYPVDAQSLTIRGGRFTTIANRAESKYNYHARGFAIRRSNVIVKDLEHRITGEGEHGAPYGGFLNIAHCANVTVCDTMLSGHKTYKTIGNAGKPVSMGSYDLILDRAMNVSFINCRQFNDITDNRSWGIMGSNFCKNLVYDRCTLSRFDAHQGVANATIRNSTLGYMGINAIGHGTLLVENTTVQGRHSFINLRQDYGSTWQGQFIIRNCVFKPAGRAAVPTIIGGFNDGTHDFGYTCHMPDRITIEHLRIEDTGHADDYPGPAIFANFNPRYADEHDVEKYPYIKTREVILKDVTTASGKPLRISDNPVMFKDVIVRSSD